VLDVPGFRRSDLAPGMRIDIPLLDPMVTVRRLGKGKVFITPERKVGVVRRRWVTGISFLRRSQSETEDPIALSDHPPLARTVAYVTAALSAARATGRVARDVFTVIEWVIRFLLEGLGRLVLRAPFIVEATLQDRRSLFWKIRGRRPEEVIDEIALALAIGDQDVMPVGSHRLIID